MAAFGVPPYSLMLGGPMCAPQGAFSKLRPQQHGPHACMSGPLSDLPCGIRRRPRRADYSTQGSEPKNYVEPEEILLVPVSHGSEASAKLVRETILHAQPEAVVVELCRSRSSLMSPAPPPSIISGIATLRLALSRGGTIPAALLRALLAGASRRRNGKHLQPGVEFRAAAEAANTVGACVVLGDRPLEVTLRRAWNSLGVLERFVFLASAVRGMVFGTRVEALEDKKLAEVLQGNGEVGVVEEALMKFKQNPKLAKVMKVLVDERDLYLAWSLKRSEAVKGRKTVVGIVGRAHVDGVLNACEYDDGFRRRGETPPLRFRDLV